ncbi:NAD(P)H-dependent oxidoreductase [Secundilactobacillus paracollinoides]|uniref:NAD(P)H-dependent oxidoreductase n=1 Tax=Secundilactobacillus paracollinoides TaxID=240427 RepID=UPI000704976D|nr:NAD(P)H-dependent oxidoreductase [Secundilactobacillus paracollinoides]
MKLAAIVGTNADTSYNRTLLTYMQRYFAAEIDIDILEIKDLPLFNESTTETPAAVLNMAKTISEADGVIISAPEYDHGVTAALKSALEWLSYSVHPLAQKPVMIVGVSLGKQGTDLAQVNLRQVLDAPGVDAYVMPGHQFLLSNGHEAFDQNGDLKDSSCVDWMKTCMNSFTSFVKTMTQQGGDLVDTIKWDAVYDNLVIGFGGAGATAARFAADAGAKVLLVDAAPLGHEGGNTRYAAQLLNSGADYDQLLAYYKSLYAPKDYDEAMLETYVHGMTKLPEYLRQDLGVTPVSAKKDLHLVNYTLPEYPEFKGHETVDFTLVHKGIFDASLWKLLRQKVLDRKDSIDIWLSSPARHLIQDPQTKMILGAQIERNGELLNIRAVNGVVLTVGGFENNRDMVQNFLGATHLTPLGSLYNQGDGIRMGEEIGAKFWHMSNYEALGILNGMVFAVPEGERGHYINPTYTKLFTGAIFLAGDDGSRYTKEDEQNRHGHVYEQGQWHVVRPNEHPHLVFDAKQWEALLHDDESPYTDWYDQVISAPTIAELAAKIGADPAILARTVAQFNHFAAAGEDFKFGRLGDTMRAFAEDGPYYAVAVNHDVLNTQGGPQRNARAEVLAADGTPIPHLYSAGELGGINANMYQAGGNLAECLIFGKIAGTNAATAKTTEKVALQAALPKYGHNDITTSDDLASITLGPDQYLGQSNEGIGGQVVVRVTAKAGTITNVEIAREHESDDVAAEALSTLPQRIVTENTADVDAVSGASSSSRAIKNAVKDALKQL